MTSNSAESGAGLRRDRSVADASVRPLSIVVLDIPKDRPPESSPSEGDQLVNKRKLWSQQTWFSSEFGEWRRRPKKP